ncbi:hypothetical protein HU200_033040 [Digitaria exilis]|uniref:F-box domain-containing protein n=1 Tax=Digitaria exilis TaxID=1010633 RepID=A0A835BIY3_9POAL|nr:hypothetical protein HU200_033040 [Digitaria exilis]CAB3488100.1 unnamed protein product [Digitaria exilis]
MENSAGKDNIAEDHGEVGGPVVPRKRKRAATDGATSGPGLLCDDVLINIFARLPARAAVACTSLSKHHHRLIRSPEFAILHSRLGAPPLPRPHIAYLATAPIKRRPGQKKPVNVFHDFHVAGGGLRRGGAAAPMRSLSGWRYLEMSYINTCNGVVLLAKKEFSRPCRCILWNPAVADGDGVEEVTVPGRDYQVLGLGYGPRSETYKLLLCRSDRRRGCYHNEYSLAICSLGGSSVELDGKHDGNIRLQMLYADGTIYLAERETRWILAFDVDDEAITSIDLPTRRYVSNLMELSGRPCIAVEDDSGSKALWVLSVDHQWVKRYLIAEQPVEARFYIFSLTAVWDCGGVLVLYSDGIRDDVDKLFVYNVATGKMFKAALHRDMAPDSSEYAICWGYTPTLVSPGSMVGKVDQGVVGRRRRELPADMVKALQPVVERDRKQGHDATVDTVSFMDVLVCIMRRLPDGVQDVQDLVELLTA